MSFNYDAWLDGQIAAYCDKPEPKERYIDYYRVYYYGDDRKKGYEYDDFTEEELRRYYEADDEEHEEVKIYCIVEEYYQYSEYEEDVVGWRVEDEPVYEGIW